MIGDRPPVTRSGGCNRRARKPRNGLFPSGTGSRSPVLDAAAISKLLLYPGPTSARSRSLSRNVTRPCSTGTRPLSGQARINLRRLRRLRKASEEFLMAATAQNLKRLVKHLRRMDAPLTMATT